MATAACGEAEEAVDAVREQAEETATTIADKVEGVTRLTAELSGAAARPDPGDPDGSGTATVNIDATEAKVCYEVAVQNLDRPTGMHIHEGQADASGPVVVPLTTPAGTNTTTTGCADADRGLLGRLVARPGDFYINVHTDRFPAGAVRGQLAQ